ncbi:MAG: acyl-ACP--UDP-N-acetylglucosamine O-acyltransferase [Lentisphaerota bacterium]
MSIHATAVVHPAAKMGRDVTIGPFVVIDEHVEIGDQCVLGPHVVVHNHTRLGAGCKVHAGAVLGDLPQDLSFKNEPSFVVIGERCVIREGVTIHRGTKPGTTTKLGNDCFLMANSHLGHNVQVGNNVILANGVLLGGYVEVGDRVIMGGGAAAHQFCRIGRMAMVGGLGAVTKDIPPFFMTGALCRGRVHGVNTIGLRRSGLKPEERQEVRTAFKILFRSGLNVPQAVEQLRQQFTSGPVVEICDFIQASKRGIVRAAAASEMDDEE